jgi:hypothetical protein
VKTANADPPNVGARITIRWSRELFERGRAAPAPPTLRREEVTGQAA